MMRYLLPFCVVALLLSGCGKDETTSYPRSYLFDRVEDDDEALFVVTANDAVVDIPVTTGTWGLARHELKADVRAFFEETFVLHEITLLNENEARIHMTVDAETTDTIITYVIISGNIVFQGLEGNNIFIFNQELDQFELCSRTQAAIPGPNVNSPGPEYNQYNTSPCEDGHELEAYAHSMIADFGYLPGDTLGLFITRFIYN